LVRKDLQLTLVRRVQGDQRSESTLYLFAYISHNQILLAWKSSPNLVTLEKLCTNIKSLALPG
jgi:hypothetical protein